MKKSVLLGMIIALALLVVYISYTSLIGDLYKGPKQSDHSIVYGKAEHHFLLGSWNYPQAISVERGGAIKLRATLEVYNRSLFVIYITDDRSYPKSMNASWYQLSPEDLEMYKIVPPSIPKWMDIKIGLGSPALWKAKGQEFYLRNANVAILEPGKYPLEIQINVLQDAPLGKHEITIVVGSSLHRWRQFGTIDTLYLNVKG